MLDRAFSIAEIKAVGTAEQRLLRGVATTPSLDRAGDSIDPMGVSAAAVLPLLLFHDATLPVGTVKFDPPTAQGITFEAHIPLIETPGPLRDRTNEAWDSVRHGLIRGVSLGFRSRPEHTARLPGGGTLFKKIDVLELSLVPIPAQTEATILSIRSFASAPPKAVKEHVSPTLTAESMNALVQLVGDQLRERYGLAKTAQALAETMTVVRRLQQASATNSTRTAAAADGIFAAVDSHVRRAVEQSQADMLDFLTALESRVANIERKR